MTERYNDKTNPEVVMVAYMTPSLANVAVARAFGVPHVLLNRKAQAFHMVEVAQ